jgi:leucyl aminopeptidase
MSDAVKVGFVPFSAASRGILVVFCDDALKLGAASRKALGPAANTIKRAAAANQFKGKSGSVLDILAPEAIKAQRLIVVGAGKPSDLKEKDFLKFGGVIAGRLNAASDAVTIAAELPDGAMQPDQAAASRRMYSIRSNSRGAPASSGNSASMLRCSTSRR